MTKKRIVLLGPPGAGKGTQARLISDRTGLFHLSTGDILREEVAHGSKLGKKAKEYMDRGDLVPDKLIVEMISERIDGVSGFILDGFPRTIAQAEALEGITDLDIVVDISLSRKEVIDRLSARRVCGKCGKIYNLIFNPPLSDGLCDECGEALLQREDDRQDVIENRYDVYMQSTAPLIDFYAERSVLKQVDGNRSSDAILETILGLLSI